MLRALILCIIILSQTFLTFNAKAVQLDYTGSDKITNQVFIYNFTINPAFEDSFYVRLPYPDPSYAYKGRWATYQSENITIEVSCDEEGPFIYEFYHYNQGFSNQGVWVKVIYPPGPINFLYRVKQSVTMNLPGLSYPLEHYTNNGWMSGTGIVDVNSNAVSNALAQVMGMEGIWHLRGYWREPEKIVNWLCQNMTWEEIDTYDPMHAQCFSEQESRQRSCYRLQHSHYAVQISTSTM